MKDQSMQNQVAIITGAAGGIGSAICRRLAQAGARIVLGYKTKQEVAQKLATTLAGEDHLALQVVRRYRLEVAAVETLVGVEEGPGGQGELQPVENVR